MKGLACSFLATTMNTCETIKWNAIKWSMHVFKAMRLDEISTVNWLLIKRKGDPSTSNNICNEEKVPMEKTQFRGL